MFQHFPHSQQAWDFAIVTALVSECQAEEVKGVLIVPQKRLRYHNQIQWHI